MARVLRWLTRTPVQTFLLCPLAVIAFECVWHSGKPVIVPWGVPLLIWGYLQYKLVGRYRGPRAGGGPGMETMPERILDSGLTDSPATRCISGMSFFSSASRSRSGRGSR
jgi:hypothetical protein